MKSLVPTLLRPPPVFHPQCLSLTHYVFRSLSLHLSLTFSTSFTASLSPSFTPSHHLSLSFSLTVFNSVIHSLSLSQSFTIPLTDIVFHASIIYIYALRYLMTSTQHTQKSIKPIRIPKIN